MLGYLYGHNRTLNVNQDLGVKVATPIGNLFGQLLFGWLADVLGRKRMCMFLPLPLDLLGLILTCGLQMALNL
jgi:MFS family permease